MNKKPIAVQFKSGKWKVLGIRVYGKKWIRYSFSNNSLYVSIARFNTNMPGMWATSLDYKWPTDVVDVLWSQYVSN